MSSVSKFLSPRSTIKEPICVTKQQQTSNGNILIPLFSARIIMTILFFWVFSLIRYCLSVFSYVFYFIQCRYAARCCLFSSSYYIVHNKYIYHVNMVFLHNASPLFYGVKNITRERCWVSRCFATHSRVATRGPWWCPCPDYFMPFLFGFICDWRISSYALSNLFVSFTFI